MHCTMHSCGDGHDWPSQDQTNALQYAAMPFGPIVHISPLEGWGSENNGKGLVMASLASSAQSASLTLTALAQSKSISVH
mmetsp:Transcript_8748/g.12140  ORF Transcript_8748/g.12140 Transcript_8748/m.12140 type:complete len:80 (-) Transcript_8748:261-500(-)